MRVLWILLSVTFLFPICSCANILAIIPTPAYSHQIAFSALWKELSLRGHKITVLTTNPQKDSKLVNLTEIDLSWSYEYVVNVSKMVETEMTMWNAMDISGEIISQIIDKQLSYEPVKNLLEGKGHFDVVLVEFMYPEFLSIANVYKCPKVLIASVDATAFFHRFFGNPTHPILNPDILTSFYGNLNFKERLTSTIFDIYLSLFAYKGYFAKREVFLRKYFKTELSAEQLLSDADMLFLNVNPVIQSVRALGPATITVGGFERMTSMNSSANSLPQDIQKFLDNAKEGFIYFSLGSNVKSKDLKKETLAAIIETLKAMPYKVLWKFEADELPGKPDNVRLIKWAPQQSVLKHPNIKLFVTQGGLQSMEESIYSEVPLVVIPFFGDQEQNAKMMYSKGIALIVEVRPYLDGDKLKTAMLEVINNPKYRNSVKRLKQLALDTPMSGLEKAVWWTEYVIRNKGAKHLRNPAADIPLYQYYLLDVIGFLVLVTTLVIAAAVAFIKVLFRFISSKISIANVKVQKKVD